MRRNTSTVGVVVSEAINAFILSDLNQVWATSQFRRQIWGHDWPCSESLSPDMNVEVEGKVGYVSSLLGEQTVQLLSASP